MPDFTPRSLTRLGVFIDGHFYHKVSTYFAYAHPRRARLNLRGLLQYLAHVAAMEEDVDPAATRVVETHYFRGRLPTDRIRDQDQLAEERRWDDVLTREGVITHYLPTALRDDEKNVEKGVDVWLALEALELTRLKGFDVVVLFSGDGDFVPLLRKLHTLGARTLLPVWEIAFSDQFGNPRYLRTSSGLSREANYVHRMMEVIDAAPVGLDPLIDSLFMGGGRAREALPTDETMRESHLAERAPSLAPPPAAVLVSVVEPTRNVAQVISRPSPAPFSAVPREIDEPRDGDLVLGRVISLKNNFGFVKIPRSERNAFFHANFLEDATFSVALDSQWLEGYLQFREDGTVQLHEIRVHWDLNEAGVRRWYETRAKAAAEAPDEATDDADETDETTDETSETTVEELPVEEEVAPSEE